MWRNSPMCDVYSDLPPTEENGWLKSPDGAYAFDWDCPEHQSQVQETIDFLIKGCACKKGCTNKQCGCKKRGNKCGPGCQCQGCTNLATTIQQRPNTTDDSSDSEESDFMEDSDQEMISTEVIKDTHYNYDH